MRDDVYSQIGRSLAHFQAALREGGSSMSDFIETHYARRWHSDALYHVLRVRTAFVHGMQGHLIRRGLLNMERVQMSLVTDPLNHDVEHTPAIPYKGLPYVTTHSMIYSKFLACHGERVRGVYVDSPNIRLEIADPAGRQRGKYLVDFSQMDVEVKRGRKFTLEDYYMRTGQVEEALRADYAEALRFFEGMLRAGVAAVQEGCEDALEALGVALEVPEGPLPFFWLDEGMKRYKKHEVEQRLGEETTSQFFWIGGLMRENYDLIYPYLRADGSRRALSSFRSPEIYNYDLCAKSIIRSTGKQTPAREILSGAIREWLYEPIVARLIDNRIIPTEPILRDGGIENLEELGGYGPFLLVASRKNADGSSAFPSTYGGGLGVERALWSMLRGPDVQVVEDVTCFGKNPDSHPIYLF